MSTNVKPAARGSSCFAVCLTVTGRYSVLNVVENLPKELFRCLELHLRTVSALQQALLEASDIRAVVHIWNG